MNIAKLYLIYQKYPTISIDTRNIKKDSIFFALKGSNFNGNKFASEALEKGAKYCIVDEENYKNEKIIVVDNALKTLQNLANYHRKQLDIPIIAITGSNGKTTTKELINIVLSQKYKITATEGNLNNHIGVPLTLLKISKKTDIGIVEMGANHQGEIMQLCKLSEPNYGIITNIGKAHIEGFKTIENIIKTKAELFDYLITNSGTAFINQSDPYISKMNKPKKHINYGIEKTSSCWGKPVNNNLFLKAQITLKETNEEIGISSQLVGNYNINNILTATCIGNHFNIPLSQIREAIETYQPKNNRSQIIRTKNNQLILDAYNANPTSVELAIKNFIKLKAKNKIIILGDMLELGEDSDIEHQKIINLATQLKLPTYFIGKQYHHILKNNNKNNIQSFNTTEDFIKKNNRIRNALILIKGSRQLKLEELKPHL